MSDLIDTTEMYLRTLYELEEEGVAPLRARIAERLAQSGPTVSQTVARMERDGLLLVLENRQLALTDEGRRRAVRVMRKHRLAERLLTDVIGLPIDEVHDEACRWEHVISDAVERRLVEMLDHPTVSPYGLVIPGLDELGEAGRPSTTGPAALSLAVALAGASSPRRVRLVMLDEYAQADAALLEALTASGVVAGAEVDAAIRDGQAVLDAGAGEVVVAHAMTEHLFVAQDA